MAIKGLTLPLEGTKPSYPQYHLHQLQFYRSVADVITCTCSTAENELWSVPAGALIAQIGWACTDEWRSSASTDMNIIITVGDTTTTNKYFTLTNAELCSSVASGVKDIWLQSTAESKIASVIEYGAVASDAAEGGGTLTLWVIYSLESESDAWRLYNTRTT